MREYCENDEASQWKRQKLDPSPRKKNPNGSSKLTFVNTSWTARDMQNFAAIGLGVFAT